jgi:hypothetical protein
MYSQEEITKAFGPFTPPETIDPGYIQQCIQEIQLFPSVLEAFTKKLDPSHYDACYREGGWSFRQVIHHIADSHMQAYTRCKLALTEDRPTVKPYSQDDWAETDDSIYGDPNLSVQLLKALHARWVMLLKSMEDEDFAKTYIHPEYNKEYTLAHVVGLYAWHGRHHYTQLARYASNQGWV